MSKILIYSDCFVFSGSENVIENILKASTIREHHDLRFCYAYNAAYATGAARKLAGIPGVSALRIFSAYNQWGNLAQVKMKAGGQGGRYYWLRYLISYAFQLTGLHDCFNIWTLTRAFKKERPEILYINNGGYPGARSCRMAVVAARRAGISKVIFNVNNIAFPPKGWLDKRLDAFIGRQVTRFITASRAAGVQLTALRGFDPARWEDIPNTLSGHDEQKISQLEGALRREFNMPTDKIIVGAVGLLTQRKGFNILIEAIQLIKEQYTGMAMPVVFIFGEGEDRRMLEQQILGAGLHDTVFLPGFRVNILEYMKDMDLFVCPSIANEDFPYVILEAMLMGKPVIGTRIAGIPEQVTDGVNGYIVPPADAPALCKAIVRLLQEAQMRQDMGASSRKRYDEHFNNARTMKTYDDLFTAVGTGKTN